MMEFSRLTVLILAELLFLLTVLSSLLVTFAWRRRTRIRRAARHLAARIQQDMEPRRLRLKQKLTDAYGYSGEVLERSLHNIGQAEKRLCQHVINGFLQQDATLFQQLDIDVDNLALVYLALQPPLTDPEDAAREQTRSEDSEEFQRLAAENQRLSLELKVTMDTMGRMLTEYAGMFSDGGIVQTGEEEMPGSSEPGDGPPNGSEGSAKGVIPSSVDDREALGMFDSLVESTQAFTDGTGSVNPWSEKASADERLSSSHEAEAVPADMAEQVLEVEDDDSDAMEQGSGRQPEQASQSGGDSLGDDLEQVDIQIPESGEVSDNEPLEAGSLEEEWAKLLAEEVDAVQVEDAQAKSIKD